MTTLLYGLLIWLALLAFPFVAPGIISVPVGIAVAVGAVGLAVRLLAAPPPAEPKRLRNRRLSLTILGVAALSQPAGIYCASAASRWAEFIEGLAARLQSGVTEPEVENVLRSGGRITDIGLRGVDGRRPLDVSPRWPASLVGHSWRVTVAYDRRGRSTTVELQRLGR